MSVKELIELLMSNNINLYIDRQFGMCKIRLKQGMFGVSFNILPEELETEEYAEKIKFHIRVANRQDDIIA